MDALVKHLQSEYDSNYIFEIDKQKLVPERLRKTGLIFCKKMVD